MEKENYFLMKIKEYESVKKGLLIHSFSSGKNKYVYDAISGDILKISDFISDILLSLSNIQYKERIKNLFNLKRKYSIKEILKGLNFIEKKRKKEGLFKSIPQFEMILNKDGERKAKFSQLVLEITQNCNFRCSYCIYSGNYKYEREHRNKNMSLETAYKAINFFFNNCNPHKKLYISFYGGEPLLRKKEIISCLKYARAKNQDVKFTIQTNSYLLDKEFFYYLREFDVHLSVSIDGPEHLHNKCRVLPSGKGTYERIISNLSELLKYDARYFRERVSISYTVPNFSYVEELIKFHQENPVLSKCENVSVNTINQFRLKSSATLSKIANLSENDFTQSQNLKPAFDRFLNALVKNDLSNLSFEKSLFLKELMRIYTRRPVQSKIKASGLCPLLNARLYVTTEGYLRICEKTYTIPVVGDLDNGIDWKIIKHMEENYLETCNPCFNCWALMLCDICWAYLYSGGYNINVGLKKKVCEIIKKRYDLFLKIYAKISESPIAFKNLMNFFSKG